VVIPVQFTADHEVFSIQVQFGRIAASFWTSKILLKQQSRILCGTVIDSLLKPLTIDIGIRDQDFPDIVLIHQAASTVSVIDIAMGGKQCNRDQSQQNRNGERQLDKSETSDRASVGIVYFHGLIGGLIEIK